MMLSPEATCAKKCTVRIPGHEPVMKIEICVSIHGNKCVTHTDLYIYNTCNVLCMKYECYHATYESYLNIYIYAYKHLYIKQIYIYMDAYTETCGFHNFQQTCITVMVDISRQPESLPRSSCQETPSANTRTTRIVPRWRQWSCFFRRNMASLLFIKSGTKMVYS